MAQYPDNPYLPREIENIPGVTYDANQKKKFYAEDLNAINDEIVELEDRLTPLTDNPLPFGIRSGDAMSWLQTFVQDVDGTDIPLIGSALAGGAIYYPMIQGSFLPILSLSGEDPVLVFAANLAGAGSKLQYNEIGKALYLIGIDDETKIDLVVSKDIYASRLFLGTDLPIAQGGTGKGAFTAGQILFGEFAQSSDLFWDDTNKRLGLGTNSPVAGLNISHIDGILASGTLASGYEGYKSAITAFQWNPRTASLRVGRCSNGTAWDTLGNYSLAVGIDCEATGISSISLGYGNLARANFAIAIGNGNEASIAYSFALGDSNTATTNQNTYAIGKDNVSTGGPSFTFGDTNTATAGNTVAIGKSANAIHTRSIVLNSGASSVSSDVINQIKLGATTLTTTATTFELPLAGSLYFGGQAVDGTWRIVRSGNNLVFQRRESGSYMTKETISA
jgi:hypothetical protein